MSGGKRFFNELIEHWRGLPCEDGRVPSKTSFSPMQLYKMLPYLFFNEWVEDYNIRIKLMGEKLEERFRSTLSTSNIFEGLPKRDWDTINDFNRTFCRHPCGGKLHRTVTLEGGLVYDLHSLTLPLLSPEGEPNFMVGLADFQRNHTLSLQVQQLSENVNAIVSCEFVDLGYGVPEEPCQEGRSASSEAISAG